MKIQALVAEFVGTFALIFVGVLTLANLAGADSGTMLLGAAFAQGLAIACLVAATAAISGGHLNPAVSLGLFVGKKIDSLTLVTYWAAQCLGAVVAALCAKACLYGDAGVFVKNGTPALGKMTNAPQAMLAEGIATFFLVFVVYGTAVDKRAPKVGGLFIGLTVTMGIFAIGPLTGGALNPARWIGPALVSGSLGNAVVYIAGPLLGGAVAGLLYANVLEDKAAKA